MLDDVWGYVKRLLLYAGLDLEGDAETLSAEEMEQYHPVAARFIQNLSISADYLVTHTNAAHTESDIWYLEDEEASDLARIYLVRARKVGWMAKAVRQVEHLEKLGDAKRVGDIFLKRAIATGVFYPANGGFKPWIRS